MSAVTNYRELLASIPKGPIKVDPSQAMFVPAGLAQPADPEYWQAHLEQMAQVSDYFNPETDKVFEIPESHEMYRNNVSELDAKNTKIEIDIVSNLVSNGQQSLYNFHGANGNKTTQSMQTYLVWLQEHAKALAGD